jgi:NitT/TauT family transport system permease protein
VRLLAPPLPLRSFTWGDLVVGLLVAVMVYVGVRLAVHAPPELKGPEISLSLTVLPWYALLSIGRMLVAYTLSLLFTLPYGYAAARYRRAEPVLLPLLDVLQSVPILSFLPVVLLSFSAILPQAVAVELASIILICTSQVWNLTFSWYQSLRTIPTDLQEAGRIFRLNAWLRFRYLELPFATIGLLWNSMMSWAGGWFFLMAAEIFTVGDRDFRLPGLGAYLKEAAAQGNVMAMTWGLATLILVIVMLDQLAWRPLLAWAERFKLEMVESRDAHASWFYNALRSSRIAGWLRTSVIRPTLERLDAWFTRRFPLPVAQRSEERLLIWSWRAVAAVGGCALLYGAYRAGASLTTVTAAQWRDIGVGLLATLGRVVAALIIALGWTLPVGVTIGMNPRVAGWLQPVVQVAASVPATALFPIVLLLLLGLPWGLNMAAILLMLMGTQWYLLFNTIAGVSAIPQDLKDMAAVLRLSRADRWRTLLLPALVPSLITGGITASGGAWNASIVAEYVEFGGQVEATIGLGAQIAQATARGDYPLLLAATLTMIFTVVTLNRLLWRRLYRLAEERFRME